MVDAKRVKVGPVNEFVNSGQLHASRPQIAILDFGSQYSHLIARRVRELNVFCELYSCLVSGEIIAANKAIGIIFSGGPSSVYEAGAPHVHASVWEYIARCSVPVLGICYGMQEIAHHFGGAVEPSADREFGRAVLTLASDSVLTGLLFKGVQNLQMWMSHGDKVTQLPPGFNSIASSGNSPHAAIAHSSAKIFGIQFHPEVTHSPDGRTLLHNFVRTVCGAPADWNMADIASEFVEEVRRKVGPDSHVIGAVSGGVDSSVAAVLLQRAIGHRFHAVMIDNGCLRADESALVTARLRDQLQIDLTVVDSSARFLAALAGVTDPEQKRRIIGRLFVEEFQRLAEDMLPRAEFLLQGTLYPDVIESISYKGPSATIKTHHNVGGLPETLHLALIEPLRELFKDEVRALGVALGIPEDSVWRHPFPGPGLAIRVLGEVTAARLAVLRQADSIMLQEISAAGVYREIGQAFVVLLPVNTVGVMGDGRTYENACAIRCVASSDFMTADWYHMDYTLLGKIANRIINEVRGINRVCYDVSSKPPATIEWE